MRNRLRRTRRPRSHRGTLESLEARVLLAGDLVAQWRAEDLSEILSDQAEVTEWVDSVASIQAVAEGQPRLIESALGGRSVIRLDTSDGIDGFKVTALKNPLSGANDFSVAVAFQTASTDLQGGQADWYKNSGLVDANSLGLTKDWGVSINAAGQLSAGMGSGFLRPIENVYSDTVGLNDGQFHVAVMTRSLGQVTLYVDGVPVSATSDADAGARAPLELVLGRSANGNPGFDGDLAEVHLYDGQLDPSKVASLSTELRDYYNNSRPQAEDDLYQFTEDQPLSAGMVPASTGVLINDTDADGETLQAVLVTEPSHGYLSLWPDGSFVYAPELNFFGSDSFQYVARDSAWDSEPATVTLTVQPKYDPAVAVPDEYKSSAGSALAVDVASGLLANDANPDLADLRAVLVQDVSQGQLLLAEDGSFTYDPQGFSGVETFTYRIDDGVGFSNTVEVALRINSPPVARDDQFVLDEDQLFSVTVNAGILANDEDGESDPLTVSLVDSTAHGQLTLNEDGSFNYQPGTNYSGSDAFTYRLSDGEVSSNLATVTLQIRPVNDAPIAVDDVYFGLTDHVFEIPAASGLLANDSDVEGDPLTAQLMTAPPIGDLTFSADGSFRYVPPAGFTGTTSFAYRAEDGSDPSSIATVRIAINSLESNSRL